METNYTMILGLVLVIILLAGGCVAWLASGL